MTTTAFRGYPHWLDLDDLIQGGIANVQDDALADVLLAASQWCAAELGDMRLDAHVVSGEQRRCRVLPDGRVTLQPRDIPLRAVLSLSYGYDPANLAALALPDPSMTVYDGRTIRWCPQGGRLLGWGRRELLVDWSYLAGFPVPVLAALASPADTSVTVTDPVGILPGDLLRCYDPGSSEVLTVSPSYAPVLPTVPPTATAVPLASPVLKEHAEGTGITGMPRDALQAVIAYGVALLMREDVSDEDPVAGFGPAARTTSGSQRGGQAGGLVNDASRMLRAYKQIVRGP
jgi:hypothetical protein